MSGGIYVAASGALLQQMRLDLLTNNLANANSPGYKADKPIFRLPEEDGAAADAVDASPLMRQSLSPHTPPFDSAIDFSAGALKQTGNALDVAIVGAGFFVVDTPDGEQYTRKGSFIVDADGNLTTPDGFAVQGEGGAINVTDGRVNIDEAGNVTADGNVVDQLRVVTFADPQRLEKTGNALFIANDPDNPPLPAEDATLSQGYIELSNVNAVQTMTQLIETTRIFETYQKMIAAMDQADGKAVNEVGKVSP
ncbi:MAG: flagellar basal-body rod protein FlgF [Desulfosarcinaceae bacterium]|nr:flagellar basal-body rod protein FlgF [Desulfosarcinaceae bacterium]